MKQGEFALCPPVGTDSLSHSSFYYCNSNLFLQLVYISDNVYLSAAFKILYSYICDNTYLSAYKIFLCTCRKFYIDQTYVNSVSKCRLILNPNHQVTMYKHTIHMNHHLQQNLSQIITTLIEISDFMLGCVTTLCPRINGSPEFK